MANKKITELPFLSTLDLSGTTIVVQDGITYGTTFESIVPNTVKNKNMVFRNHGDAQWGPTAITGFWNGIDAPTGGYTIYYLTLARQEPVIYVAHNDTECINLAKFFGGSSITTINDAVTYFSVTNPDTNIFDENGLIT